MPATWDTKQVDAVSFCETCGDLREAHVEGNDYDEKQRGPCGLVMISAERHARRWGHNVTYMKTVTTQYLGGK